MSRRSERHALKRAQRALTDARSSSLCWYAAAGAVAVDVGGDRVAHVSQVHRCGSVWACPVCAPVVRERRAQEIDEAVSGHLQRGGGAFLLTSTVRHHSRDLLGPRLALVSEALHVALQGSGWRRRRERLGVLGLVRAVEVTHGGNGWHPHNHALGLTARPLTSDELEDLERWYFGRWSGAVEAAGFGSVSRRYGVDLRPVTTAGDLGGYLTKVEGGWSAGRELARADLKRKGCAPLDLLRSFVATGEVRWARLWQEYEAATFDRRAIRWSPGLRAQLLGSDQEVSDVEAAASEGAGLSLLRALVPSGVWNRAVRAGETGDVLARIEEAAAALLTMAEASGHDVQVLDVPEEVRV